MVFGGRVWALAFVVAAAVLAAVVFTGGSRSEAQSGGYLEFTGPDAGYMEVPDDPALSPGGELTLEAWVYLYTYLGGAGSESDCPMIVAKNWNAAYALGLACGGDIVDAYVNGVEVFDEAQQIPLNSWAHIAMTYDGVSVRSYVNGQLAATAQVAGPLQGSDDPLQIGHDVQWDRTPDGRVDDVRIWGVARTESEIQAGMNGVPANTLGLIANWRFDGTLGDVAGGRNGVLVGDVELVSGTTTPTSTPTHTSTHSPTPTNSPAITPTGTAVPVGAKGDASCDQRIDAGDVKRILQEVADTRDVPDPCDSELTPSPTQCPNVSPTNCDTGPTPSPTVNADAPLALDLNCDGLVNALDALVLLLHIAGIEPVLPGGCAPIGVVAGESATPTPTATRTMTPHPTVPPGTSTITPDTPTPRPTTPGPSVSLTPTPTVTPTPTPVPTATPTDTPGPTPTELPTPTPTPADTGALPG